MALGLLLALLCRSPLTAQSPPPLLSYQGRLVVGGVNFDGVARFKFALVSGTNGIVLWSNDGTVGPDAEPSAAVPLPVSKGLYGVLLGDTGLPGMLSAIPAPVFVASDVRLRVWSNGGSSDVFLLMAPDQRVAPVGYAHMAAAVADGSITSEKLAPGAIGQAQLPQSPVFTSVSLGDHLSLGTSGAGEGEMRVGAGRITLDGEEFLRTGAEESTYLGRRAGQWAISPAAESTGIGFEALWNNQGYGNVGVGTRTLANVQTGSNNTAVGYNALARNSGDANTAVGGWALASVSTDNIPGHFNQSNTALGFYALVNFVSGYGNLSLGARTMQFLTNGDYNISLGADAGTALIRGNHNIYLDHPGSVEEDNIIRIGNAIHTDTYLAGTVHASGISVSRASLTGGLDLSGGGTNGLIRLDGFPFLRVLYEADSSNSVRFLYLGREAGESNGVNGGLGNTGIGHQALRSDAVGSFNTALGYRSAMELKDAVGGNTALGALAFERGDGFRNTAVGFESLSRAAGSWNVAVGWGSLGGLESGGENVGIGTSAGETLRSGNNNIYLANFGPNPEGDGVESNVIRIGNSGHTNMYVAGVFGVLATDALPVYVNNQGKLGTINSSARFKEGIRNMGEASAVLDSLRPVTFRYRTDLDPSSHPQYGLIAEEVNEVAPDLVVRNGAGEIQSVRYEAVSAMLLNEFQKERRQSTRQAETIRGLRDEVGELKSQVAELSALVHRISSSLPPERGSGVNNGIHGISVNPQIP